MFNEYEYVICKNSVDKLQYGTLKLTKYKKYYIVHKYESLGATWFNIEDDSGMFVDLTLQEMKDYFFTEKEIRKLKLNKLNENR